jgi:hypothetical protein
MRWVGRRVGGGGRIAKAAVKRGCSYNGDADPAKMPALLVGLVY